MLRARRRDGQGAFGPASPALPRASTFDGVVRPVEPVRPPADRRARALWLYVAAFSVLGLLVPVLLLSGDEVDRVRGAPGTVALLAALLVFGERTPVRVRRQSETTQITASTTFAFALLLLFGPATAVLGLYLASIVADVIRRLALIKLMLNAAQYSVALGLAGVVYAALAPIPLPPADAFGASDFVPLAAAGAVFCLVNLVAVGTAILLDRGYPALLHHVRTSGIQASTDLVSTVLAPIAVVVAGHSLWLIAVLVLPLVAVRSNARLSAAHEHQARHDVLTGLANRTLLHERMQQALLQAKRTGEAVAVMLIDLDRFKEVNDRYGHQVGDDVLRQVAARLAPEVREVDTAARLGGDEFAVLLVGMRADVDATVVARRIVAALRDDFAVGGVTVNVGASIGIAVDRMDGADVESLLRQADAAMYRAKATSSGLVVASH